MLHYRRNRLAWAKLGASQTTGPKRPDPEFLYFTGLLTQPPETYMDAYHSDPIVSVCFVKFPNSGVRSLRLGRLGPLPNVWNMVAHYPRERDAEAA